MGSLAENHPIRVFLLKHVPSVSEIDTVSMPGSSRTLGQLLLITQPFTKHQEVLCSGLKGRSDKTDGDRAFVELEFQHTATCYCPSVHCRDGANP